MIVWDPHATVTDDAKFGTVAMAHVSSAIPPCQGGGRVTVAPKHAGFAEHPGDMSLHRHVGLRSRKPLRCLVPRNDDQALPLRCTREDQFGHPGLSIGARKPSSWE